jgi:hypothetical protein
MEDKRRLLRTTDSCNQLKNIFHKRSGARRIVSLIPDNIAPAINSTLSVSCLAISNLYEFRMQKDADSELCSAVAASDYQQQWQIRLTTLQIDT